MLKQKGSLAGCLFVLYVNLKKLYITHCKFLKASNRKSAIDVLIIYAIYSSHLKGRSPF
jgi:hypothetical protein